MQELQAGQRITLPTNRGCTIQFSGKDAQLLSLIAISHAGQAKPLTKTGKGQWRVDDLSQIGRPYDIVAYIADDREGGFVTGSYPLIVSIGNQKYQFPAPEQQLSAIIIAEIYDKDGEQRAKISNEGHTFGISAYVRARNLQGVRIPHQQRQPEPNDGYDEDYNQRHPAPSPNGRHTIGTGSGVIVCPNLIVTNAHVVEGGDDYILGQTRTALTLLFVDKVHDLALLTGPVSAEPIPMRTNSPIWLGEDILAAGYPLTEVLGADLKVTTGNVSGLAGGGGDVSRFQFSAPIGSGSSGGAIIDEMGNLIGIVAASLAHDNIRERGSISENVNFGVRASLVCELIAASGRQIPQVEMRTDKNRRDVIDTLRHSVVNILIQ